MNKHSIVNLNCPCFLFRYPNLDIPSQALFNLHRPSALPLWCGSEDDQNFQSPPGHSRPPGRRRWYCMVPGWNSAWGCYGEWSILGGLTAKILGACGPLGFGLGTSLGTPFTMITPRLFQIKYQCVLQHVDGQTLCDLQTILHLFYSFPKPLAQLVISL